MATSTATRRRGGRSRAPGPAAGRRAGGLISLPAVVLAALLAAHRAVPGAPGTLIDTALPWLGLGVPALAAAAALRRAWPTLAVVLLPAVVWAGMFGESFVRTPPGGPYDLRAVSQNMYAGNEVPEDTAAELIATKADVLAVQELAYGSYPRELDRAYPHQVVRGTVGLWSRWPITASEPVSLKMGWTRALRAEIGTPAGRLTVIVAHLGSARPGATKERDATMGRLALVVRKAAEADRAGRLLVLGDLNTATTDREMGALVPPLREAQETAGEGFGFSWPADFPVTRPDHILYRGIKAVGAAAIRTPGTDHRAVRADFRL